MIAIRKPELTMRLATGFLAVASILSTESVNAQEGFSDITPTVIHGIIVFLVFSLSFLAYRYSLLIAPLKNRSYVLDEKFGQSLIDISPDAIVIVDQNMCVTNFNPAAEKLFGYERQKIIGQSFIGSLTAEKQKPMLKQFLNYCKNKNDAALHPVRLEMRSQKGSVMATSTRVAVSGAEGRYQYIFYVRDKIRQLEAEDKLHQATYNDALTGLPNRYVAVQHIRVGITDAQRQNRNLVVMKISLDRFKHINESLGHEAGDQLLIEIASRLQTLSRRGDLVSRINGDQFAVILVDIDKSTNLDVLVRKYMECFSPAFRFGEHVLHISVSIGVACFPHDAGNVEELLRAAESAMFQAKQKGGTGFRYYSQEMSRQSKERLYLENELRRAIRNNQLDVYYQPQVDLASGKILGVEALVRWNHPSLGAVSPIKFIPVAEEIGLISEIGHWVMKRACSDMTLLKHNQNELLRLSINLSARQFQENDLVKVIANVLNETGFPPDKLELEITESLFMEDVESVAQTLTTLSQQGIKISMDDFGTGYSSLSYLKRFPINTIKVDRSFVKDMTTDKDDASIVAATIQMAHSLSLDIVAEGVETEDQLQFLLKQKCDKIQGFYFSRPLTYKALVNLMEENRQIDFVSDKVCLISKYR